MSIFELFRKTSESKKPFTETDFWDAIDCIDLEYAGDGEALMSTLVRHLEDCSDEHIFAFDEKLAELLFTIDGKQWAEDLFGTSEFSETEYLSARCNVIANGKRYYNDIVSHREKMKHEHDTAALASAGAMAWAKKHHKKVADYPLTTKFSPAAHSNEIMWQ
ncbi:MAG: DUF4240 domain-containing protein [Huintestinicola sp.]